MSSIWISDIQQRVYAIVKKRTEDVLKSIPNKSNYDNLTFTQESEVISTKVITPVVLIQEMPTAEIGKDLEQCNINGFVSTFQIDVSVSKTQGITVARRTIYEVVDQFKKLNYEVVSLPKKIDIGNADIKRMSAKVQRNISENDTGI